MAANPRVPHMPRPLPAGIPMRSHNSGAILRLAASLFLVGACSPPPAGRPAPSRVEHQRNEVPLSHALLAVSAPAVAIPPLAQPDPTDGAAADAAPLQAAIEARHSEIACQPRTPKRFDEPQAAMDFYIEQRLPPGSNLLPLENLRTALLEIQSREAIGGVSRLGGLPPPGGISSWTEIGPRNIGGRTRALVIDPVTPSTMYAAGVAGGVWKSTDGGGSWSQLDDLMLNIAVCSLAIDPVDPNVLYAGTGEGFFNGDAVRGLGIFKTVNGGATWTQLAGTTDGVVPTGAFYRCNDIVISPNDHNHIYAATRYGVWRSVDAGATWSVVLSNPNFLAVPPTSLGSSAGCTDLAIRTDTNPDTLFAAFGIFDTDGLYQSTDGGGSWTRLGTATDIDIFNQGRMSIAIAPSNNNTIYLCMADNGLAAPSGTLVNVFRSLDGGASWTGQIAFPHPINPWLLSNLPYASGCFAFDNLAQGWYDNVIAVDPMDEEIVWVGGVDLFRSNDGGVNFEIASYWWYPPGDVNYVHADQHVIVFHPQYDGLTNGSMYVGNDGGIHYTQSAREPTSTEDCFGGNPLPGVRFEERNSGYGVTQFYHGDSAQDRVAFGGGTQDNGTLLVESAATPDNWLRIFGGDGGYFAFDHTDSQIIYAETQRFPRMIKSYDGGMSFSPATNGITDSDGLFITPFEMDPVDPLVLYTGGTRPWRTIDGADNWELAASPAGDPFPLGNRISALAPMAMNPNRLYVGFNNGIIARSDNVRAATPTWVEFGAGAGLPSGFVSSLAVDPRSTNTVYATFTTFGVPHILRSVNGGASWSALGTITAAGVPDIPVHCIALRPCNPDQLYAGTELGVFVSENQGATWTPSNNGLAHTVVEKLDFTDSHTLVAFTHGRGAYRALLAPCLVDCNTNGTDDAIDIGNSTSTDCNGDLIPDDCLQGVDPIGGLPGDTTNDGSVDGGDVALFVGVLVGGDVDPLRFNRSDMNDDSIVDCADHALLLAKLLD